ncbi:hypothetical protein [Tabrizicola sp. BL-A-41-H6]|uniref:hypothetical protein n=1 Tax=Tabrizicola sp. BL-A-41-H6 TaxID=3421107 RepID=UPI003D676E85
MKNCRRHFGKNKPEEAYGIGNPDGEHRDRCAKVHQHVAGFVVRKAAAALTGQWHGIGDGLQKQALSLGCVVDRDSAPFGFLRCLEGRDGPRPGSIKPGNRGEVDYSRSGLAFEKISLLVQIV